MGLELEHLASQTEHSRASCQREPGSSVEARESTLPRPLAMEETQATQTQQSHPSTTLSPRCHSGNHRDPPSPGPRWCKCLRLEKTRKKLHYSTIYWKAKERFLNINLLHC